MSKGKGGIISSIQVSYGPLQGLWCGKALLLSTRERRDNKDSSSSTVEGIQVQTKHGQSKRKVFSLKHVALGELIRMIKDRTKTFIKHNFTYRRQVDQYRECLNMFPSNTIVSVVDFSENYSFKEKNEIQFMHWHTDQCTILVHIAYWHSDTDDSIVKEMHFYIFDDKKHDTLFVHHCFLISHKWHKEPCLTFSTGCGQMVQIHSSKLQDHSTLLG